MVNFNFPIKEGGWHWQMCKMGLTEKYAPAFIAERKLIKTVISYLQQTSAFFGPVPQQSGSALAAEGPSELHPVSLQNSKCEAHTRLTGEGPPELYPYLSPKLKLRGTHTMLARETVEWS